MSIAKRNFKVLLILLAVGIGVCATLSVFLREPETERVFTTLAITLSIALVLQVLLFFIAPQAFKNKER